jgi:hypothetical protein
MNNITQHTLLILLVISVVVPQSAHGRNSPASCSVDTATYFAVEKNQLVNGYTYSFYKKYSGPCRKSQPKYEATGISNTEVFLTDGVYVFDRQVNGIGLPERIPAPSSPPKVPLNERTINNAVKVSDNPDNLFEFVDKEKRSAFWNGITQFALWLGGGLLVAAIPFFFLRWWYRLQGFYFLKQYKFGRLILQTIVFGLPLNYGVLFVLGNLPLNWMSQYAQLLTTASFVLLTLFCLCSLYALLVFLTGFFRKQ